jgi:hypothetical protein
MSLDPEDSRARGPNPDRGNVRSLVLRAWLEPGAHPSLRVRMVEIDAGRTERRVLVTASIDQACHAVRRWLEAFHIPRGGGDARVTHQDRKS